MITKIKTIQNFRNFLNFSSDTIELTQKEIIFAQNWSGKTNLSRLIEKISEKADLGEFLSQEAKSGSLPSFEIVLSDGTLISDANYKSLTIKNIAVFNSDYVERNVRCDNFSSKDISGEIEFTVWEADIEVARVEGEINKRMKRRLETVTSLRASIENQRTRIRATSGDTYTLSDRSIWDEFSLDKLVNASFFVLTPQTDTLFESCEKDFLAISSLDEKAKIAVKLTQVKFDQENISKIENWLKRERNFPVFDPDTREKIEHLTNEWLSESHLLKNGVQKSLDDEKCLLCDRVLDPRSKELFQKYQNYFANEESKFKAAIDEFIAKLNFLKAQAEALNNNDEPKVSEYSRLFDMAKSWSHLDASGFLKLIEDTISMLNQKKSKPGEIFNFSAEVFLKSIDDLNSVIKANIELIETVNKKLENTWNRKTGLRKAIGKKFLYQFYLAHKSEADSISIASSELAALNDELKTKKAALPKKRQQKI